RTDASRRALLFRVPGKSARPALVALCRAGSAAIPQGGGSPSSGRRARFPGPAPLSRPAARPGARRSLPRQRAVRERPHLGSDRLLLRRRRLPPLRRRGVREQLVPGRSAGRPPPRRGAREGAAGGMPRGAAVQRARARRVAGDVARRRAALLAVAAVRLSPAASGHAGARARPRALPRPLGAEDAGPAHLGGLKMQAGLKVQARIVAASRGARWLGEGWRLFRPAPFGWLALSSVYLLGTNVLALIPVVGVMAALVLVPPLTVGMMAAARAASVGAAPRLAMLAEGLRTQARAQLALGLVYLGCSMLIFAAMAAVDGAGGLREAMSGRGPSAETDLGALALPIAVFALLYL